MRTVWTGNNNRGRAPGGDRKPPAILKEEVMLCIICRKRKAELPDRNYQGIGRPIKKICKECHSERLKGDLVGILETERKRRPTNEL